MRNTLISAVVVSVFWVGSLHGQNALPQYCLTSKARLICELPYSTQIPFSSGSSFNAAFATQLTQLPLASASSTTIIIPVGASLVEPVIGLGPVFPEQGNTVGKHKLYVSFTYQHFAFDESSGLNLNNIPLLGITSAGSGITDYNASTSRIDAKVDQYVVRGTFGITSRVDATIALPFERVSLGTASQGTSYFVSGSGVVSTAYNIYNAGSAGGLGDVVLGVKGRIHSWFDNRLNVAAGFDFRIPSGDELNYLGSGAFGYKPYVALSHQARVSEHVEIGGQLNGTSDIFGPSLPGQSLPAAFLYSGGVDVAATRKITFLADLLGARYSDAPILKTTGPYAIPSTGISVTSVVPIQPFPDAVVKPFRASYNVDDLTIGGKYKPWKQLLFTAGGTFKLNDGGLRSTVVPFAGVSYTIPLP